MVKNSKNIVSQKTKIMAVFSILIAIIILYFLYSFYFDNGNNYLIKNKYYGFQLKTPNNWFAIGKTIYTEENIRNLISECRNKKLPKEIGVFRFESQKYPETFGDKGYSFVGINSGAILEVTVGCILDDIQKYQGNIIIDDENAIEDIINIPGFGKTSQLSLVHNDLQYKIKQYIYISSADNDKTEEINKKYNKIFDNIISSFKFIK